MGNKIFGPAMVPDKKMYRSANGSTPEHMAFFSADTIYKLREKFHANNFDNNVNINHNGELVEKVILTKSFILNDENRSDLINEFLSLPNGTWMVEYEIENIDVWEKVKSGEIKGFSIEGYFLKKLIK